MNPDSLPYRACAGAVALNPDGLVWVGKRKASPRESDLEHVWQLPQGGIARGEAPEAAARRELREETGMRSVRLLAEAPEWIRYDLPGELIGVALKGLYRGQEQRWFAYRFEGEEEEIALDPPAGEAEAEFDEWKWMRMEALIRVAVPFKRDAYRKVAEAFAELLA